MENLSLYAVNKKIQYVWSVITPACLHHWYGWDSSYIYRSGDCTASVPVFPESARLHHSTSKQFSLSAWENIQATVAYISLWSAVQCTFSFQCLETEPMPISSFYRDADVIHRRAVTVHAVERARPWPAQFFFFDARVSRSAETNTLVSDRPRKREIMWTERLNYQFNG